MWEIVVARFTFLIALTMGSLLIVLYPIIKKVSIEFALISLIMGGLVLLLLMIFIFESPNISTELFGL